GVGHHGVEFCQGDGRILRRRARVIHALPIANMLRNGPEPLGREVIAVKYRVDQVFQGVIMVGGTLDALVLSAALALGLALGRGLGSLLGLALGVLSGIPCITLA